MTHTMKLETGMLYWDKVESASKSFWGYLHNPDDDKPVQFLDADSLEKLVELAENYHWELSTNERMIIDAYRRGDAIIANTKITPNKITKLGEGFLFISNQVDFENSADLTIQVDEGSIIFGPQRFEAYESIIPDARKSGGQWETMSDPFALRASDPSGLEDPSDDSEAQEATQPVLRALRRRYEEDGWGWS